MKIRRALACIVLLALGLTGCQGGTGSRPESVPSSHLAETEAAQVSTQATSAEPQPAGTTAAPEPGETTAITLLSPDSTQPANSQGPADYPCRLVDNRPQEDTAVILHNPDMGFMTYENYCVARNQSVIPSSAGEMRDYDYPGVDYVAVMFTWADVEQSEGEYVWDDVDRAYDYWKAKGKRMMLRMSTESLLWYSSKGKGIPDYLYNRIPEDQKQTLTTWQGNPPVSYTYRGVDFRNQDYQRRLKAFLEEVNRHFGSDRPVEYIDLAGYGLWGEWHAGYIYPGQIKGNAGPGDLTAKREGLKSVLDIWSDAFPRHWLSLSYSYDPDSPARLYQNSQNLVDYERWSMFDYALTKSNITWRRNGAGGAVQATDRVFGEKAFGISQGPFAAEAAQGYDPRNVAAVIDDELSLHPNYMNIPGWCWEEGRRFLEEQPELYKKAMLNMGYRLVPTALQTPDTLSRGRRMEIKLEMLNRGVGKAPRDYSVRVVLTDSTGRQTAFDLSALSTKEYVKGQSYQGRAAGTVPVSVAKGTYQMTISLYDAVHECYVAMAVKGNGAPEKTGGVCVGSVTVL